MAWLAGDADGSTDRLTGFDNDGVDQDLLDLSAVLTGATVGTPANLTDNLVV